MVIYTFIHPTKSGGTSVEDYFKINYNEYIKGRDHYNICQKDNNPIIIVRDVESRFLSMYKYWKNGSSDLPQFKRDKQWIEKYKDTTINDFIDMLKNKDKQNLYHVFTWSHHFEPTTKWINTNYEDIIVIKYEKNLNNKIQKLINALNIPNKNVELSIVNKSVGIQNEENILNDKYVIDFIQEYFKEDIKLINTIEKYPELFKLVI